MPMPARWELSCARRRTTPVPAACSRIAAAARPAVVVGRPGIGKTFYARKLAGALGVPTEVIATNLITDRGAAFSGLAPIWRASAPRKVAKALIEGSHACPLIVIDEIEKASPINPSDTPGNALHSLLERENAARFVDEFVDLPIRADHVFWFATAIRICEVIVYRHTVEGSVANTSWLSRGQGFRKVLPTVPSIGDCRNDASRRGTQLALRAAPTLQRRSFNRYSYCEIK